MADNSPIEWTDATWNPVTGCTKISPGCKNCYAERLALRLREMGNSRYANGFSLTLHPEALDLPFRWTKPKMIFVNSMSDLFHDSVPEDYIRKVFDVMVKAHWHKFQILTKRADRLSRIAQRLPWPAHIWQGVSIESQAYVNRVPLLRRVPATVRFLSIEPLLGPIPNLPLEDIHWVIVGGESGPGHRPIRVEWVRDIRKQCVSANVPFFFKQWGGRTPKSGGRKLDGRFWDQMPQTNHTPLDSNRWLLEPQTA